MYSVCNNENIIKMFLFLKTKLIGVNKTIYRYVWDHEQGQLVNFRLSFQRCVIVSWMKCYKRNFPPINSLESYSLGVVDVAGVLIPPTFNKLITLIPMLVPVY